MPDEKCIVVVLGTAQDAGIPQIGCHCSNCSRAVSNTMYKRLISSLGIINQETGNSFVIDCTPDFRDQYFILDGIRKKYLDRELYHEKITNSDNLGIKVILLTHAHMGHYLGLTQLGKECAEVNDIHLFGTKKMVKYLNANRPYKDLIKNNNIRPITIEHGKTVSIDQNLTVTPFLVNHRQDYTDTVGFSIQGPNNKLLYAPDFDTITQPVLERIPGSYISIIDGTFYQPDELSPRRDMRLVPHATILDTMKTLKPYHKKSRIFYTHFNHTNPVVDTDGTEANYVKAQGFGLVPERWTFSI